MDTPSPDTSPDAAVVASGLKKDWADAAAYNAFFSGMRGTQLIALTLAAMVVAVAYGHAPQWMLIVWSLLAIGDAGWRVMVRRRYAQLGRSRSREAQLQFARRHSSLWVFNGVFWGLTPLALFSQLPLQADLVAWLPVIASGFGRTSYLASHLRTARLNLAVFAGGLMFSVAVQLALGSYDGLGAWRWCMPAGVVLYVLLLARLIRVHHARNARNIDLLYQNQLLIQSLQEQTRAAKAAAEFRTRFLAGAAHDLKQPISALGIYAEWLGSEPRLVDELAPKILQATQAVNTLFDSLFDLAKIDANHIQPKFKPVELGRLLSDLQVQLRPLAVQKGLTLRFRPFEGGLISDPIILHRILGNLISNAIRYTAHGGVLVAVRRRGQFLVFEIWDTGIGIAADQQARIFGEFYKVQQGGTEDGFGLGLALVRRLATMLNYTISLRSRLTRGTVFRVQAPCSDALAASTGLTAKADRGVARNAASEYGI